MDFAEFCGCHPRLVENLLNAVHEAVLLVDAEGLVLHANPSTEHVLGFLPEELYNQNISRLFTEEDLKHFLPNILFLCTHKNAFEGEALLRRKNGNLFFAHITATAAVERDEGDLILPLLIRDIDRRKRLEKAFDGARYEDLIKIANGIAHELRNPLVGVGGFVNRLYKSCAATDDDQKYYHFILNNLRRIDDLVKKVEYLVSLPKPYFRQESIQALLLEAVQMYQDEIEAQGIQFTNHVDDTKLLVDRDLVVRLFCILLENALEAVQEQANIRVECHLRDDRFLLCFSDNGPGIAATDLPFIFNPFFSTKALGSGIDLAVAKRIMEEHGGSLEAVSEPGQGCTFEAAFPIERRRRIRVASLRGESTDPDPSENTP